MGDSVTVWINQTLWATIDVELWNTTLFYDGDPMVTLTHQDMDKLGSAYGEIRNTRRPLNGADISSMIQNLAGDEFLKLRAVLNRAGEGYSLLLVKQRNSRLWRIKNWHDWYEAQREARG